MIRVARLPNVIRFHPKLALLFAFVALGPLGNLLTPSLFPPSFRLYYFLLPLFPLFYLPAQERIAKMVALLIPLVFYSFFSACLVEAIGTPSEPFPLFRWALLFCQIFFIIGASSLAQGMPLLKIYITSYFLSLVAGYILFLGYYFNLVSLEQMNRFTVLTQFSFDILRFSPGSYPNEYGIVSSFVLSLLTLFLMERSPFSKTTTRLFFFLTFLAFLLTTTRAAYLAYLVCLLYLSMKSGRFFKHFFSFSLFAILIGALLRLFRFDLTQILRLGFSQKITEGSLGERYLSWKEAIAHASQSPLLGTGFASLTNIHNVYLQLLFELGLLGSLLLLINLFANALQRYPRLSPNPFFRKVQIVGLIHILSFAASNHNLNHHLTWFVCLLGLLRNRPTCLQSLRKQDAFEKIPSPKWPPPELGSR